NEVQSVGPKFGIEVTRLDITKQEDIVPGLEALKDRVDGLYVCTDPLLTTYRTLINTFALREKLPTMYAFREYVLSGGLMSYGPNFPDLFRRAGDYVDKILRGVKPADIPIEQPVKFDLIINLKTAKTLGLTVPDTLPHPARRGDRVRAGEMTPERKPPHGPPMTLGNMRALGVQRLVATCLNDACRHQGLIAVPQRRCQR